MVHVKIDFSVINEYFLFFPITIKLLFSLSDPLWMQQYQISHCRLCKTMDRAKLIKHIEHV